MYATKMEYVLLTVLSTSESMNKIPPKYCDHLTNKIVILGFKVLLALDAFSVTFVDVICNTTHFE